MPKDFLSSQIRTSRIIGNGSSTKLVIYPDSKATDNTGGIDANMLQNVGSDVYLYVSGSKCGKENNIDNSVVLFGGDVVISGSLYVEKGNTSLWETDPLDSENLVPTNILDGDTGLFALDFNVTDYKNEIIFSQYTMTSRSNGSDKYFEFDSDNNVIPRDIDAEALACANEN